MGKAIEGVIKDAKKRYSAGVLKYRQMGYWDADDVPKDTETVCLFRITPQEVESIVMSFMVNRPKNEPGFGLARQEVHGRTMRYTAHSYATDRPETERGSR
jgi:hypothetical protein